MQCTQSARLRSDRSIRANNKPCINRVRIRTCVSIVFLVDALCAEFARNVFRNNENKTYTNCCIVNAFHVAQFSELDLRFSGHILRRYMYETNLSRVLVKTCSIRFEKKGFNVIPAQLLYVLWFPSVKQRHNISYHSKHNQLDFIEIITPPDLGMSIVFCCWIMWLGEFLIIFTRNCKEFNKYKLKINRETGVWIVNSLK